MTCSIISQPSNIPFYMDGVGSSVTLDLTGYFQPLPTWPQVPNSVISVSCGGLAVASSSLAGFTLTLNFSSAPTAGIYTCALTVGY
jgi:hypothetical protein